MGHGCHDCGTPNGCVCPGYQETKEERAIRERQALISAARYRKKQIAIDSDPTVLASLSNVDLLKDQLEKANAVLAEARSVAAKRAYKAFAIEEKRAELTALERET